MRHTVFGATGITKKRTMIALAVLLAGVLGAGGSVGYLTFVRSADNPPARACRDGRPSSDGPVVVAAGASMTQGTLGADWVGALRERPEFRGYAFVNAGKNGNTAADLRQRVDTDIVNCHPDRVLLLIGTNDVRNNVPVGEFRADLGAIVDRIRSTTTARIALLSLPPLGEDLDTAVNHTLAGYNTAIHDTATHTGADYLPLHEQFADHLRGPGAGRAPYDFSFLLAYRAAAEHYLVGRSWDEVGRSHGLELLVDHIHLSDRGRALVTHLAAEWLTTEDGTTKQHP